MTITVVHPGNLITAGLGLAVTAAWFTYMWATDDARYTTARTGTLAPAVLPPEPPAGARATNPPAGDVGTGGKRAADPVNPATKGENPGPARLPEGDTQLLWPPQETVGPGNPPAPKAAVK